MNVSSSDNPIPSHRFSSLMGEGWSFKTGLDMYPMSVDGDVCYSIKSVVLCRPLFDARNPYTWDRKWRVAE